MSYEGFYRYIYKYGKKYWIIKDNEWYTDCKTLEEALYERDRLILVNWDWDLYLQLAETVNGYIHISLPPFEHKPSYVVTVKEHWEVRGKGRKYRYYGTYQSEDEAKKVARIYNGRIIHYPLKYRVQRHIDGKNRSFGYYDTLEEAEDRVIELIKNGWIK